MRSRRSQEPQRARLAKYSYSVIQGYSQGRDADMDCLAVLLRVRSDSVDDHTIRLQLSDGDLCTMETDSVSD